MPKTASTLFRERVRALRKDRGWTQEKAAEACGIGYKLFQHYELGIKQNPGLLTLEKIADGFGLTLAELLNFERRATRRKPPGLSKAHKI